MRSQNWWFGDPKPPQKSTSLGPSLLQGSVILRAVHFSSPKNGGLLTKSGPGRLSWSVAHLRLNLHDLLGHSYVDIFDHIWCTVWHGFSGFFFGCWMWMSLASQSIFGIISITLNTWFIYIIVFQSMFLQRYLVEFVNISSKFHLKELQHESSMYLNFVWLLQASSSHGQHGVTKLHRKNEARFIAPWGVLIDPVTSDVFFVQVILLMATRNPVNSSVEVGW